MVIMRHFLKSIMTILLVLPLVMGPAWAQNIKMQSGIIAATSGLVRVVSEDIGRVAETGQKIYLDDLVETGVGGKLQIMLMDRTTMTIGPNTSLVIDEFVFDPGVERTLSATVLKGTFKLASPSLFNKGRESREIKLPNAVVAIRGTELIGSVSEAAQNVVLLNGAITVANDGFTQDIERPNFGVNISETGEISQPEFFSSEDLGVLLNQLDGELQESESPEESSDEESSDEESSTEEAANEDGSTEQESSDTTETESGDNAPTQASTEGESSEAPPLLTVQSSENSEDTAPAFIRGVDEGPEPTEAEVVAAAEAIADGSADINDLQVLSRAGPGNIAAVANVLGVEFDEQTGEISPEAEAVFAPTINAIIGENGLARPSVDGVELEAPALSFNFDQNGLSGVQSFDQAPLEANTFSFETFSNNGFSEESFISIEAPTFDRDFSTSEFFAPAVEFDPIVFEGLAEFSSFETETDFFFEPTDFFLMPANFGLSFERTEDEGSNFEIAFETLDQELEGFDESPSANLDNLVTEALEEVIADIATDTSSVLQDGTFMPSGWDYRSWNGSEWSTIAQNFDSGQVRFEHNNAVANFYSGSYCSDCSAVVSNTVTIDFTTMKYQFEGAGEFNKPGYNGVEFSATTPQIPLNYWELSAGSILRLPNERELESTYNNAEVYTLTSSSDPNDTVDATIDLDFIYDTHLSDNNDVSSNIGVYGRMAVEYTETGSSKVTLRTPEEAMQPVQE